MVAPGQILGGKYQVERLLGEGGMGLVVAARHLHLDQRVAIKLLSHEHLGKSALVERFLREARAAVRLRSEHVARVLDAGKFDDGAPYLVMEYLEGRDLAAELAQIRRLPVATAVDFVLQVCEAVAEAHQAGIIHRDLKPANIFVTRDEDGAPLIKVLDFGISKVSDDPVSDLTSTKMVLGSPPYMSPEQLRASRTVDARSDVWSLGVVLYELLSGARPFVGASLTDLVLRISADPPEPLACDAPSGLEAVIARCLAKQPTERYATVGDLAAALALFGGAHGHERVDRIRRRTSGAIVIPPSPSITSADNERTTLSSANGTLGSHPPRPRPRYMMIGGVAVVVSALAIGAAVAVWPAHRSTSPASAPANTHEAPLPRPESPPSEPPPEVTPPPPPPLPAAAPSPPPLPAATTPDASAGSAAGRPGAGAGQPAAADVKPAAVTPAPPTASKTTGAAALPTGAGSTQKPTPRPPARRVTRQAGSAEDLTKSQY